MYSSCEWRTWVDRCECYTTTSTILWKSTRQIQKIEEICWWSAGSEGKRKKARRFGQVGDGDIGHNTTTCKLKKEASNPTSQSCEAGQDIQNSRSVMQSQTGGENLTDNILGNTKRRNETRASSSQRSIDAVKVDIMCSALAGEPNLRDILVFQPLLCYIAASQIQRWVFLSESEIFMLILISQSEVNAGGLQCLKGPPAMLEHFFFLFRCESQNYHKTFVL